ncbi:hypothetical protein MMC30_001411 [Trapelia coarctata]|nr:hypothetical protein [Trapelia coarctata]
MGKEPKKTVARKPRPTSRTLLRWDDDMDIQLLLSLQRACNRKGMKLPWDEAALFFGPTVTGGAVIQHLSKLRQKRIREDLPVPDALTRGGGGGTRGKSQKTTSGNTKAAQKTVTPNGDDDDEDFDVDKASDSEASFGEERNKRNKREAKSSAINTKSDVSDSEDEEYGKGAAPKTEKVNKNNKGKGKKQTSGSTKAKRIKAESSASPSVAAAERAAERNTRGKATQYKRGEADTVTESDAEEPRLAAGSSFLKLVGVNDNMEEETNGSDDSIQDTEKNLTSEDVSEDGKREVTVLKLCKSERSLAFLRQLGSSHIVDLSNSGTASLSSATSRSQSKSLGVDVNMTGNDFNPQYFGHETGYTNFGSGTDGSFGSVGNFNGFQPFQYSAPVHSLMPPTPLSGVPSGGFRSGPFGGDVGMDNGVAYSTAYYPTANVPAFSSPHTPTSSRGLNGLQEITFGEIESMGQTSYGASSHNIVGMGGVHFGGFGGIGTTGVGDFQPVSSANECSSADLAGTPTTSGHPFDWTTQNHSVMSSVPLDDDMSQFMDSAFNGDIGELGNLDANGLDNLFSEFETGPGGAVDAHEDV